MPFNIVVLRFLGLSSMNKRLLIGFFEFNLYVCPKKYL